MNGHSGGFEIPQSELRLLLTSLSDTTAAGLAVAAAIRAKRAGTTPKSATVRDVLQLVDEFPGENIYIEEQERSYFVIHLDQELRDGRDPIADKWIIVDSKSPLFSPFRERDHAKPSR